MKVVDFCRKYDVNHIAVYNRFKKSPEIFEPHLTRDENGKVIDMDDDAVIALMPLVKNGEMLSELMQEIKELRKNGYDEKIVSEINSLRDENSRLTVALDIFKYDNVALAKRNENLEERISRLEKKLWSVGERVSEFFRGEESEED